MPVEKSLLAKIREKELEVSVKIDDARVGADHMIDRARKDSLEIITTSEKEGKKAADDFLESEMKLVQAEADQIRTKARNEVESVRQRGEKNLPRAVERITSIILSG